MKSNESTEPVRAAAPGNPEFLDAEGVEKHFGIRRSLLFRLLAENRIRGVSIRKTGRLRGKRLFDCSSIRELLRSNIDRCPQSERPSGLNSTKKCNSSGPVSAELKTGNSEKNRIRRTQYYPARA
jgi:hypothetical protein